MLSHLLACPPTYQSDHVPQSPEFPRRRNDLLGIMNTYLSLDDARGRPRLSLDDRRRSALVSSAGRLGWLASYLWGAIRLLQAKIPLSNYAPTGRGMGKEGYLVLAGRDGETPCTSTLKTLPLPLNLSRPCIRPNLSFRPFHFPSSCIFLNETKGKS